MYCVDFTAVVQIKSLMFLLRDLLWLCMLHTNVSSLNGRRYLNNVQNNLTTTYQRLSSGIRINSAKDDAAGLQIADCLTPQIREIVTQTMVLPLL